MAEPEDGRDGSDRIGWHRHMTTPGAGKLAVGERLGPSPGAGRAVVCAVLLSVLLVGGYASWRVWQMRVARTELAQAQAITRRGGPASQSESALTLLESAVQRDPRHAAGQAALSDALWVRYQRTRSESDARRAMTAAQRALELRPQQPLVLRALANMYYRTGNLPQAEARLRIVLAMTPQDDEARRMLGRVLAERGGVDEGGR